VNGGVWDVSRNVFEGSLDLTGVLLVVIGIYWFAVSAAAGSAISRVPDLNIFRLRAGNRTPNRTNRGNVWFIRIVAVLVTVYGFIRIVGH
jgi:hypothetical protein